MWLDRHKAWNIVFGHHSLLYKHLSFSHFRETTPYTEEQPLHSPILHTGVGPPNENVNYQGVQWRDASVYFFILKRCKRLDWCFSIYCLHYFWNQSPFGHVCAPVDSLHISSIPREDPGFAVWGHHNSQQTWLDVHVRVMEYSLGIECSSWTEALFCETDAQTLKAVSSQNLG